MTESLLTPARPGVLLTELRQLAADISAVEKELPRRFNEVVERLKKKDADARAAVDRRYEEDKTATQQQYTTILPAIEVQYQDQLAAAQREYRHVNAEIVARFESGQKTETDRRREAQWEANTVSEAAKNNLAAQVREIAERLGKKREETDAVHDAAVRLLKQRGHWREFPPPAAKPPVVEQDPLRRYADLAAQVQGQWQKLAGQALPRLAPAVQFLGVLAVMAALAGPPIGLLTGYSDWLWVVGGGIVTAVILPLLVLLSRASRRHSESGYLALRQVWSEAVAMGEYSRQALARQSQRQGAAIADRLKQELQKAESMFAAAMAELNAAMQKGLDEANTKYPKLFAELTARHQREIQEADAKYSSRLQQIEDTYRNDSQRLASEHAREMAEAEQENRRNWDQLAERWRTGVAKFRTGMDEINAFSDRRFPDLSTAAAPQWQPADSVPPVIRVGRYDLDLEHLKTELPANPQLRLSETRLAIPALPPFPERSTLLLETGDDAGAAVEVIQAVMLRMLMAYPPGKIRFTIIDPVGLGESFAAFMHLADYDEKLVNSRIWTEGPHIEQRLADLSEHMENVIQIFLRNEFETIQQYNESAGEMAEPYRVLVVANFPANFSEAAMRRLVSIINSGARCGVFTVLSFDPKSPLPRELPRKDIEPHALTLCSQKGEFCWTHPDAGSLRLVRDPLPDARTFTELVRAAGRAAKSAAQVEVPFSAIAPGELWNGDSREEIDVPLGRAGARKLQHLRLGKGTAQHVLISGKSGSGKSTLLHVLATTLAMRYSPDEVELYLVDFKKGVEFKAYAAAELPHARVIAIESEREFGLSVLQRLDAELQRRGDLFRNHSAQDVKGFRAARPDVRLPRALLVIDEFQELFIEDDRIAQDAALLLDRLVRQGRAFGVHVLLGSQTLAGAYSLPRATMGQMAVRIALQCAESDAHLILSEDNTAARLLSRPGEAIYNDANGLFEGNHPFQIVWLPEAERDEHLREIRELAGHNGRNDERIVFEGNAPADIRRNPAVSALLAAPAGPPRCVVPKVWLGSPVAIKEATAAELPQQGGSNLLVIGHRGESILGMLAAAVAGLAAQYPAAGTKFLILDGTPPDTAGADCWSQLRDNLPHELTIAPVREAGSALGQLAAEVARRVHAGDENAPPIYLIVCNLGRFRELRKGDDAYGFSRLDENKPLSPAQQLGSILSDGPAVGVHTLLWCDTYNTLQRFFERRQINEFELRVAFHMNATDSSTLIESPLASQLGPNRAILYHVSEAWQEKFCPYGPPPEDWLREVLRGNRAES